MEMQQTTAINNLRVGTRASAPMTEEQFDSSFKPRGAMAFFVLLILLCGITWYGIYLLMLSRA